MQSEFDTEPCTSNTGSWVIASTGKRCNAIRPPLLKATSCVLIVLNSAQPENQRRLQQPGFANATAD